MDWHGAARLDRDEEAIAPLKRAVDITRTAAVCIRRRSCRCSRRDWCLRDHRQSRRRKPRTPVRYTVAETAYGKNDLRLLARSIDLRAGRRRAPTTLRRGRCMHARSRLPSGAANTCSPLTPARHCAQLPAGLRQAESEDSSRRSTRCRKYQQRAAARMFATSTNGNERTLRRHCSASMPHPTATPRCAVRYHRSR